MKTRLLKKFRAKYSIKWIDIIKFDPFEDMHDLVVGHEYYLVDNQTGFVFLKKCESIRDALLMRVDDFLPFTMQGKYLKGISKAELGKQQRSLKKLIESGKRYIY